MRPWTRHEIRKGRGDWLLFSTDWRRERVIRRILRGVARQRVAAVLPPDNVWVVEHAVGDGDEVQEALRTCHMRGWLEPISEAVPTGDLTPEGRLPPGRLFSGLAPIYRLTD